MRILISGSTGFLGTALIDALSHDGHTIVRLVRGDTPVHSMGDGQPQQHVKWDPAANQFDASAAEGMDALVHLAGASIAGGRWTKARKEVLRASRIDATRHLMAALSLLQHPPKVIVGASAVGYYGDRGEETLTESSAPGSCFLATLCREWESETQRAVNFGARVAMLRFGVVLSAGGGALPAMAAPFKFGAGGPLGSGRQWMSWVTLADVVGIVRFALSNPTIAGPLNAVTPNPVRNKDFTQLLAQSLHRPAILAAPAFALKIALGEMAEAVLLASQRVEPTKLRLAAYPFKYPDAAAALAHVFER